MLNLTEIQLIKDARDMLIAVNSPIITKRTDCIVALTALAEKYDLALKKMRLRARPISREELIELKIERGMSVSEICRELKKRKGCHYSTETVRKAISAYQLVGLGKQAELYNARMERSRLNSLK